MSRTARDADALFEKMAKPETKSKPSQKKRASEEPEEEKPTARLSVSLTPSMKRKLDAMVYERKQAGEKTSASDIVRQLLEPVLGK